MAELVALLFALALMAAFFALTGWEARRGARLYEAERAAFDRQVARGIFIIEHVDVSAYVSGEVRRALARFGHFAARLSLDIVRIVERFLARTVRRLRMHRELSAPARPSSRAFLQTLSEFKEHLHESRPEGIDKPLV